MNGNAFAKTTMAKFVLIMMAVVFITESKASNVNRCNTCDQVYRSFHVKCPENVGDCGACIKGFEEREDKSCHYVWNVDHNSNASIIGGNSVILSCIFETSVDCLWYKDQPIEIVGRLTYINSKGFDTRDCSIKIRHFQSNDVGKWICSSIGTSSHVAILQSIVQLHIINDFNESESLLPNIEVKQLNEYRGLVKSKRSTDHQEETSLWLECKVTSILPVTLYWTLDGKRDNSIAAASKNYETGIFLNLPMRTEKEKGMRESVLICSAEYPTIKQHFSDEFKFAFDYFSAPEIPHPMPMAMIVLICGVAFLGAALIVTSFLLFIFLRGRKKKTTSAVEAQTNEQKTLLKL